MANQERIDQNLIKIDQEGLKDLLKHTHKKESFFRKCAWNLSSALVVAVALNFMGLRTLAVGAAVSLLGLTGWHITPPDGDGGIVASTIRGINNAVDEMKGASARAKREFHGMMDEMRGKSRAISRDMAKQAKEAIEGEMEPLVDEMKGRMDGIKDAADKAQDAMKVAGTLAAMAGPFGKLSSFGDAIGKGLSSIGDGIRARAERGPSQHRSQQTRPQVATDWQVRNEMAKAQIRSYIANGMDWASRQHQYNNWWLRENHRQAVQGSRGR